jgi:transcriptional regulator with XRE-family HTH domain
MATETAPLPTLARQIHALRRTRGWSQPELAAKVGASAVMIGRYERGEMIPAVDVVAKIAEALGVTLDHLYHNTGIPTALQDQSMLDRWATLESLPSSERKFLLAAFDGLLRDAKARQAYRNPQDPTAFPDA